MATRKPDIIRVTITHSAEFYKAREKYFVYKVPENGFFVTMKGSTISIDHAKQMTR